MHGFALEYGRMASGVFAGLGRSTLTPAEPFKSGGDGFLPPGRLTLRRGRARVAPARSPKGGMATVRRHCVARRP
jgi:hypothetical protein